MLTLATRVALRHIQVVQAKNHHISKISIRKAARIEKAVHRDMTKARKSHS